MRKRYGLVASREPPELLVFDFTAPSRSEISPGVHALFAFLEIGRFVPALAKAAAGGALLCTYRRAALPETESELVSKESLLPVSIRCNVKSQLAEKQARLLALSLVVELDAAVPVASTYRLVDISASSADRDAPDLVPRAVLGGRPKWLGEPLAFDASFLFQLPIGVLNRHIRPKDQMMDVAELYGFVEQPSGVGPCGFCLSQG